MRKKEASIELRQKSCSVRVPNAFAGDCFELRWLEAPGSAAEFLDGSPSLCRGAVFSRAHEKTGGRALMYLPHDTLIALAVLAAEYRNSVAWRGVRREVADANGAGFSQEPAE